MARKQNAKHVQEQLTLANTALDLPDAITTVLQTNTTARRVVKPAPLASKTIQERKPAARPHNMRTSSKSKAAEAKPPNCSTQVDRSPLLTAVALQDHIARTMGIPGGPRIQPSIRPGANMTLAQHLGLIPRPPPLLSKEEWNEVHLKARLRQHSVNECPICQEDFGLGAQVLLSCSHVFHKSCLTSFEKYARVKCCPLCAVCRQPCTDLIKCRAQQYQKKLIQDGAESHKQHCATRIQAAYRGWVARKRVQELRKHRPPSDPRLKRVWAADRLQENTSRLVADMETERGDLDALFAELDAGLALSRSVGAGLASTTARRMQEQQTQEAVASSGVQDSAWDSNSNSRDMSGYQHHRATADTSSDYDQGAQPYPSAIVKQAVCGAGQDIDWDAVVSKAKARGHEECPICIGRLNRKGRAGVAWLSCTHCFHLDCITAFEAYELSAGGTPCCPVCRAAYQRKCFA